MDVCLQALHFGGKLAAAFQIETPPGHLTKPRQTELGRAEGRPHLMGVTAGRLLPPRQVFEGRKATPFAGRNRRHLLDHPRHPAYDVAPAVRHLHIERSVGQLLKGSLEPHETSVALRLPPDVQASCDESDGDGPAEKQARVPLDQPLTAQGQNAQVLQKPLNLLETLTALGGSFRRESRQLTLVGQTRLQPALQLRLEARKKPGPRELSRK